jgi:cathepsin B
MSKSKSPKKDGAPPADVDPEMKERARKAMAQHSKKKEDILDKYSYHIVFGVLIVLLLVAVINSLWKSGPDVFTTDVNDEAYINKINSQGLSFKVGPTSMFNGYKLVDAKKTINVQASNKQQLYRCNVQGKDTILPDSYNFRTEYPACARPVYTQGNCSSSYSIAAATTISDRLCRNNKEDSTFDVSPQTPVFCDKFINSQCKGGYISRTLDYAKLYGLVDTTCAPYDPASDINADNCTTQYRDCNRIKIGDYCVASDTENIKLEIFNYGPVIVTIPVYRDFLIYKEGLYQVYPKNQKFSADHAVKIIGWDIIDNKNAWIIENSWGSDWGINGTAYTILYVGM